LFYKPRDAEIDAAVIDLFREINHLPQDEQHTRPPLPEYKIMNCVSHDGSPASIWEYIEGDYPDCNIDDYVKKIPPENEKVKNCVKHLESVCRALGVSDLHRENIVVRSTAPTPTSFKHEIVPIDLENLQFGASTGMFSLRFQPPPLSDQEHALINQCREKLKDVLVRYVPLGTSDFLGALLDYRNCTKLTTHIIQQMKSDGYRIGDEDKFVSLQERLEFLMLQDLVRGDVPYCVVRR